MQGKIILVTGATSGIGAAITRRFHFLGATVIMAARNETKLQAMTDELGSRVYSVPVDFSELDAVEKVFSFCKTEGLLLDGAVHCAGITLNCPIRANDPKQTENLFRINLGSFLEICHFSASKRYMRNGGAIIGLSSTAALCQSKGLAAYSASKAGVDAIVKTASMELVDRGIRINAIAPGDVNTPMFQAAAKEAPELLERLPKRQPLGLIEPERIADVAEFLMSEKACNITGETIIVGSGIHR